MIKLGIHDTLLWDCRCTKRFWVYGGTGIRSKVTFSDKKKMGICDGAPSTESLVDSSQVKIRDKTTPPTQPNYSGRVVSVET